MHMTVLGTAASAPSRYRNVSASVVDVGGDCWLFDCGEGTMRQMTCSNKIGFMRCSRVFITHMHSDHVLGLPSILASLLAPFMAESLAAPRRDEDVLTLRIYGPRGISRLVANAVGQQMGVDRDARVEVTELLGAGQTPSVPHRPQSPYTAVVADADGTFHVVSAGRFSVKAAFIKHTVPCLG
jgi:ribonuclease Z